MLTPVLDLSNRKTPDVFDYLYTFFHRDFIAQRVNLGDTLYVDPKGQGMRDGKEEVFWHITTREQKKKVKRGKHLVEIKSRPFDPDRSCRIEWVKPMMLNHNHASIRLFYRKETRGKKPIRLYLWAHQEDFVVIVQKLGRSRSYLVTSFYITERYKRQSYQKWYSEYQARTNPDIVGCEWF